MPSLTMGKTKDKKGGEGDLEMLRSYFHRYNHAPSNVEMAFFRMLLKLAKACPGDGCSYITVSNQHLLTHMKSQSHGTEPPSKNVNSEKIVAIALTVAGQIPPAHTTPTTAQPLAAGSYPPGLGLNWDTTTATGAAAAAGAPTAFPALPPIPTTRAGWQQRGHLDRPQTFQGQLQHDHGMLENLFPAPGALGDRVMDLGGFDTQADATMAFQGGQQHDGHGGTAGVPFPDTANTGEGLQPMPAMHPLMDNFDVNAFFNQQMPGPPQQDPWP